MAEGKQWERKKKKKSPPRVHQLLVNQTVVVGCCWSRLLGLGGRLFARLICDLPLLTTVPCRIIKLWSGQRQGHAYPWKVLRMSGDDASSRQDTTRRVSDSEGKKKKKKARERVVLHGLQEWRRGEMSCRRGCAKCILSCRELLGWAMDDLVCDSDSIW